MLGSAAIIASIAMAGLTFSTGTSVISAGGGTYEPTYEPTFDPCLEYNTSIENNGEIVAFGEEECVTETQGPAKTHTPTAEPTELTEPTEPPATATTAPPDATDTPTGGAAGGGIQPPATGTGDAGSSTDFGWLFMAGAAALAVGGAGALGYGLRRR